ncbi:cell division protein FtsL [Inhella crocodyli]|jgi:cell division protein FtsL|uniref:Cell division protein FtsL n=2 Tax=Inhella crocodyli TaxID=2499851 RepID=A0A3S2XTL2_9BURK|nr:cell division protein FtsL [Inhella crocodyli]
MWVRMNVLLLIALVVSAVLLVRQTYEGRRLFADLERAKAETRKLEADVHRLQAEREGEATNLRVEQLARDRLQMRPITPALTLGAAASAAPAASTPASGSVR